jgi:ubiquinone biosynthesis protein
MKNLLRIGFETMFKMIYELGIFHADPHPGNMIAVWRSTGEEKHEALAFIDFGIVGYITKEQQRDLLLFLNALVNGDVPGVTRAVMRLGVEGERVSPRKLEQIIGSSLAKWRGNNLGEEPLSHIAFLVIQRCIKERVAFPADVILLVKAYVTMEGSARWLDPELDFTGMAKPLLAAYFKNEYGPSWIKDEVSKDAISLQNIIRELPYAANILMRSVERGKVEIALDKNEFIKWEKLEELQTSKKSLALIAGSFFMGSAMIAGFAPSLSWGGLPLYQLGFLLFLITLCMFIIVSITTHKYVEHQWKER